MQNNFHYRFLSALFLAWATASTALSREPADGLVLDFTFDKINDGMVLDESGLDNHGKIVGASPIAIGGGIALRFEGGQSLIDCGNAESLQLTSEATLEAWVKPDGVPPTVLQMIVGRNTECSLFGRSGGWIQFPTFREGSTEAPFYEGLWHHLVGTFDGTSSRIYIDGAQQSFGFFEKMILSVDNAVPFTIGGLKKADGESEPRVHSGFTGLIGNVRIYNRALPPAEVEKRYLTSRAAYGLNIRSFVYPFNHELVVEVDNVPEGASLEISLLSEKKPGGILHRQSTSLATAGFHEIHFSVPDLKPGNYIVKASTRDADGTGLQQERARFTWPKRPAWPTLKKGQRVLNNFVTELLAIESPAPGRHNFTNPRKGWVFIASTAPIQGNNRISIYLDAVSSDLPILIHTPQTEKTLESMRFLPAGDHRLRIEAKGRQSDQSLIVRTMPETLYIRMCQQPGEPPSSTSPVNAWGGHVIPQLPLMTWDWLWNDVLRNCNSLSAHYGARSRFVEKDRARAWKTSGRKIVYEQVVPGIGSSPIDAESAYKYWAERDPLNDPLCDTIGADEFGSYSKEKFDAWTEALQRLRREGRFDDKQFMAFYNHGCYYGEYAVAFADMLAKQGDLIGLETYLYEVPLPYARSYFEANIRDNLEHWAKLAPGIQKATLEVLGYFCMPTTGNWGSHSRVDFKVFTDKMFKLMANDPVFWELAGVSDYASRKADEEIVRWVGQLYRHYCIEGKTDLLSKEYGFLYELNHIRNVDFADGLDHWDVQAAEPGSVDARHIDGLQNLFVTSAAMNADYGLVMTRSRVGPNRATQPLRDLRPGRAYLLTVYTGDYGDMANGISEKKELAVTIEVTNTDLIPEKSFQLINPSIRSDQRRSFHYRNHQYYHGYHHLVFRARETQADLVLSDWASPEGAGGPTDQQLVFGLLELRPYFE